MKETYNLLTQRMEQLSKNINKKVEPSAQLKNQKSTQKSEKEQKLYDKAQEIKEKQKKINILSKENQNIKKSIDRFYELDANKNIVNELKDKEQLQIQLQNEIDKYEDMVKKNNTQCISKINKLKDQLNNIENKLQIQNTEFHDKNKDYIYLNCKFSLHNKQSEEEYNKLKNKKNYLDMNKHNDF